jgi:type IV secretion system protein VirB5
VSKAKEQQQTDARDRNVSENPYLAARREWSERYGSYMASLLIALLAVAGVVYIGTQSHFVPYVVEVNKLGDTLAVAPVLRAPSPDNRVIKASLARWVTNVRTVYIDGSALRQNIVDGYSMVASGSPAAQTLNAYFHQQDPFVRAKNEVVSLQVEPPMPVTDHTWRLEWQETLTPRQGGTPITQNWAATVTFALTPPTTEKGIIANPTGLFITQFNWAQRL